MAKKGIAALFIIILGLTTMISNPAYADKAVVSVDHLHVRNGPGTDYKSLGMVNSNESYTVVKEQGKWVKIKWNHQTGWVAKWHVSVKRSEKSFSSKVDYLRIRAQPGLDSKVLGYLMKGDEAVQKDQQGKWIKVNHSGTSGWVHRDYLTDSGGSSSNGEEESNKTLGSLTITTSILNVRSKSSTDSSIVDQVYKNENYDYISEQQGWYKIKLHNGQTGWVAGWFTSKNASSSSNKSYVTLQYNGTNLRSGPSTENKIVGRAGKGDQFNVIEKQGKWYKISYKSGEAFVAGWIVEEHSGTTSSSPHSNGNLSGRTIMIDPGHGGKDTGALGYSGSHEKSITLQTAFQLKQQLESSGANVILTRSNDEYVALSIRALKSRTSKADVFLSLHFNSVPSGINARGIGTYYYHDKDRSLAENLQKEMVQTTGFNDRGVRFGDFHVIRENNKPALLLELGFISNSSEEAAVKGVQYQKQVSQGITNGLIRYFNE
ncbi:SH3 domain-containing protein [Halobacillus salinarum]|uniref:SH3 domain-containing protein n=1 Tax=Halobacillus salinarum TaxID=2932257 RepID=A0ABY4EP98_9BACI|nr:SH3 domain-containing protein [Halobacillus salinarum]UOQ46283.1 SH3 domain-containing protein [Halobacillus salinarum]